MTFSNKDVVGVGFLSELNCYFLSSDVKYPKVASWDSFFQSSVSRVLLTLVGSPPGSSPDNRPDPNRSVDIVPVSDKQSVQPQQTSPIPNGRFLGCLSCCWLFIYSILQK